MLTYYRSLTLVAVLLLAALGCSDDSDENDCRGRDDDGDGLIFKCGEAPPDYDSGAGTGGRGGSGGGKKDAASPTRDAGDDRDGGNEPDDDAGN